MSTANGSQTGLDTAVLASRASTFGFVALSLFAVVLFIVGLATGDVSVTYLAIATIAFLIPLGVGVIRGTRFDPFEPISLVALAIFFGTTLRAYWLVSSESSRVDFIMMGTDYDAILGNAPLILASILSFSVGYFVFSTRIPLEKFRAIGNYSLTRNRMWLTVAIGSALGFVGLALLASSFDISFSQGLTSQSFKRVHEYVDETGEVVYGSGTERFIAGFGAYTFLFFSALILAGLLRLRTVHLAVLGFLGILAIAGPFLTSSRSSIVLLMFNLLIFMFYYKKLRARTIILSALAGFFVVASLGAVREANQTEIERDMTPVDRVLGSGNSLDFVRTSAIIDRVPEVRPYLNGSSYLALLAAPIPRSVWLNKPQVGLGPYVKGELFGEPVRLGGWPSGMIAEGWMNFGYIGLILPMLLFGAMLRVFYESCRPLLGVSFPVTLIYAVSIWRLGFGTIGMNFAHGITQTLAYFMPVLILLIIARAPRRASVSEPAVA